MTDNLVASWQTMICVRIIRVHNSIACCMICHELLKCAFLSVWHDLRRYFLILSINYPGYWNLAYSAARPL